MNEKKCAHPENRGLECDFWKCPRAGSQSDWEEMTQNKEGKCGYIRSEKWKPKT